MTNKIIPTLLILISTYFNLKNKYIGFSLIILIASSIYLGHVIKEGKGKGKREVGGEHQNLPPPQSLDIGLLEGDWGGRIQ